MMTIMFMMMVMMMMMSYDDDDDDDDDVNSWISLIYNHFIIIISDLLSSNGNISSIFFWV